MSNTNGFYECIHHSERLHRLFLDVIKVEMEKLDVRDINSVQCLLLYNIGEDEVTVGELTARGFYLGSNVTYNAKKLTESNYLMQERSRHDRRSVRVRLSTKGAVLRAQIAAALEFHANNIGEAGITEEDIAALNETMTRFEKNWRLYVERAGHITTVM
ncbi:MAG: MarR family winged helix-turn-helix transcriptional regulator [Pseudomonadota bacterium]|nr:MarR family winged helix-turn-helix transcriptional regulator [Pseudomonadota bacterium]